MKFEIGKISEFDGYNGKIISKSGTYIFLDKDILNNNNLTVDDYVIFRGEQINDINRAYFVQYFAKDINNVIEIKSRLVRILKRVDDK